jgi:FixJ family two-component response regulator
MQDRLAVLDDDPAICEIVRLVGGQAGFEVQAYGTVAEFRADKAPEPAVILLDLCLSDLDGVEILRGLAGTHSRSRIVLMTGADPRSTPPSASASATASTSPPPCASPSPSPRCAPR